MRRLLLTCFTVFLTVPAFAQTDPLFDAWDACVASNTADYAQMFGAVSIDDEDLSKALEDCYEAENAYAKAHPGISVAEMAQKRAQLRAKYLAKYKTRP